MIENFPGLTELAAIAQIFATFIITYTVIVYVRQAKAMESQIKVQQQNSSELQFYQTIKSLLDMRADIERILSLENMKLENWTNEDKASAIKVCSQFHFIGVLIHEKLIPERLVAETWYYSIPKCYKILKPFIAKMRQDRDPRYWTGFDFLAKRVIDLTVNFNGFM